MGVYEKLHLANNVDALDLLAKRSCNVGKLKFQQICNALNKLYKESQSNVLDQEKTYILLARYISLYNGLMRAQEDKKFVELRFGSEYEKVCVQYDETRKSLERRYCVELENVPVKHQSVEEPVVLDIAPHHVFHDAFISCQQLFSALQGKCNILLVDARPDYDFAESKIDRQKCINVPDQCITSGLSANALGKKLPEVTQGIWEVRDDYDVIVLFDWNTSSDNFASTKLDKLRSALVDWDLNRKYKEQPVILNGGYLEMLQTYPTLCTNPLVYLSRKNNELDELLELDDIIYPTESDNKNHVMGIAEDSGSDDISIDDEYKDSLIAKYNEIITNRQEIETRGGDSVSVQETLEDLDKRGDDVKRELVARFQYDPDEEISEDVPEKLKILDIITEERDKELRKARAALKPKKNDVHGLNNNHFIEYNRPAINRATKPHFRIEPVEHLTAGLIGLRNIRNTCYMSTVIQCLRNIPKIKEIFCNGKYVTYNVRSPAAIVHETAGLIRQLWSKSLKFVDPQDFYSKAGTLEATYRMGNHEDCMEFFLFLLNHLSEDCSYEIRTPDIMTPKQKAWYNQFEGKNSIFIDLFYHQIRIQQNCYQCEQKTIKFEIESTFMLSVPEHDFNLNELMRDYMADYVIPEYCCAKCKEPVINKKEFCYEPDIVVIVLKRYRQTYVDGVLTLKKVESRAHFQEYKFRLGKDSYNLNAIAMHSGDMNFGHYTAAALTSRGWYEFNDEAVRPININDDLLKVKACAFFYSR